MVANWVPVYLPVIVPSSLISIFTELFVISRMRLSLTLDLMVRLCRAAGPDDFVVMTLEKFAGNIDIDGANPSFIRSLKIGLDEDPDYERAIARYKSEGFRNW